jgi:hypothetical protein
VGRIQGLLLHLLKQVKAQFPAVNGRGDRDSTVKNNEDTQQEDPAAQGRRVSVHPCLMLKAGKVPLYWQAALSENAPASERFFRLVGEYCPKDGLFQAEKKEKETLIGFYLSERADTGAIS